MNRRRWFAVIAMVLGAMRTAALAEAGDGPLRLLEDINPTLADDRSSHPDTFRKFGDLTLFRAWTHGQGGELWRTDGTEAGTYMLKDIHPGPSSALFWNAGVGDPGLVEVGGAFLFMASDGVHNYELWRTDGTKAGTSLLKDIQPGSDSAFMSFFSYDRTDLYWHAARCGDLIYFLADDGGHGFQLWRTDGTSSGTFLVFRDGGPGSLNQYLWMDSVSLDGACIGGVFHFRAGTIANGFELWRSDGTPGGTSLLRDIVPGPGSSYPGGLTAFRGGLVFSASSGAGSELWKSDGTQFGTVQVKDIVPGPGGSNPRNLTVAGDLLYFESSNNALYRSDGTAAGTFLLRAFSFNASLQFFGDLNGRLLFRADDGVHGPEPWVSDGTPFGTVLLKDTSSLPYGASIYTMLHAPGAVYFWTDDGVHGVEPWRSDGTTAGTRMLADLNPGPESSYPNSMALWAGGVLFSVQGGIYRHGPGDEAVRRISSIPYVFAMIATETQVLMAYDDGGPAGRELWRTDGTEAGTRMLKDLEPLVRTQDSYPVFLGNATRPDGRETAVFSAWGSGGGVWASDGTARGTSRLAQVTAGQYSDRGTTLHGVLYFAGTDLAHGYELWRSDGTPEGTRLLVDLLPGDWGGLASHPVAFRDRIYFMAETDDTGRKWWSSDGTPEGTAPLGWETPPDFHFPEFIVVGDRLYLEAYHPDYGYELFAVDGPESGVRLVHEIGRNFGGGCCLTWFDFHGRLLFIADDGQHGWEPWITDGTEEGTFLLKDIFAGRDSSYIVDPQPGGPYVYFAASDAGHGRELWRTDGTEGGTVLVKDILPGVGSSFPNLMGDASGALVFVARDATGLANDLWRSDGSEVGTTLVKRGCNPRAAVGFDGVMLYSDTDDDHGYELWRTDGTAAGTVLVQDLAPGPDGSYPDSYHRVGTSLLLRADGLTAGLEAFGGRLSIVLGRPDQALRELKAEVTGSRVPRGLATALTSRLDSAAKAIAAGREVEAVLHLETFVRLVDVMSRPIGEDAAENLTTFAQDLLQLLQRDDAASAPAPRALRQALEP